MSIFGSLTNPLTARIGALCAGLCIFAAGSVQSYARGKVLPNAKTFANTASGEEFYLTFPQNLLDPTVTPNVLDAVVYIASNYLTHATVQLLGTGNKIVWQTSVVVDSQGVAAVTFPHQYDKNVEIQDYEDETVLTKAVHVTADQPVVVYGLDHRPYTTDGYLALPPSTWGNHYSSRHIRVFPYKPNTPRLPPRANLRSSARTTTRP